MTLECPPDIAAMLRAAARQPLVPAADRREGGDGLALGDQEIERLLPHRGAVRLIDGVTRVNRDEATIVCQYDLGRAAHIVEGHFPGHPVWPGVLQVEAIGQAGLCLVRLLSERDTHDGTPGKWAGFALTHILGAEFVRPVTPVGRLEIVARVVPDGLFTILVGQCLQHDAVCCAAAVRGISEEHQNES